MDVANSSLLDEATAAAEAMVMALVASSYKRKTFFVDSGVLPQTLAVLRTRAKGFGIQLVVGDARTALSDEKLRSDLCGVLLSYPDLDGQVKDFHGLTESVHAANALVAVATDLLALTMLKPPGEWGADIAFGNSARFGKRENVIKRARLKTMHYSGTNFSVKEFAAELFASLSKADRIREKVPKNLTCY